MAELWLNCALANLNFDWQRERNDEQNERRVRGATSRPTTIVRHRFVVVVSVVATRAVRSKVVVEAAAHAEKTASSARLQTAVCRASRLSVKSWQQDERARARACELRVS